MHTRSLSRFVRVSLFLSPSLPLSVILKSKETEFLRVKTNRVAPLLNPVELHLHETDFPPFPFREEERRIELLDGYLRRDETN